MLKRIFKTKDFRYILLYGIIGGLAAIVDFSIFTLCVKEFRVSAIISNLISMHIGMLVSFSLNTYFNFKKTDKLFRRFLSYYSIVLVGMGISTLIIMIGTNYLPVLIVKLIAIVIVTVIQYLFNRLITYKF